MQGPREDATQHGAAATPTDVGIVGTAVGVAPTPDPTATSSVWRNTGSFALGLGKAYAHQVLDYTRSTTLNVLTLGGYGFFKFWWHIGEKAGEAIVESQRLGEHGFDVALSGLSGGLSAVSPLHQVAASITNIKTAAKEGDYERLGEAAEPVVVAIVTAVVTGKLAGAEAGAAEEVEGAVQAGEAGAFGPLHARRIVGDNLTPHHMPQDALGFTSRNAGGALVMEKAEHALTRTFKGKGGATARAEAGMSFRDVLARDIRDVRRIVGPKYDQGLRNLLGYYYDNFPGLIGR